MNKRRSLGSVATNYLAVAILLVLCTARNAEAYVGPGLGAGVIASVLGMLGGLLMLLFGAIWYPLKKLLSVLAGFFKRHSTPE